MTWTAEQVAAMREYAESPGQFVRDAKVVEMCDSHEALRASLDGTKAECDRLERTVERMRGALKQWNSDYYIASLIAASSPDHEAARDVEHWKAMACSESSAYDRQGEVKREFMERAERAEAALAELRQQVDDNRNEAAHWVKRADKAEAALAEERLKRGSTYDDLTEQRARTEELREALTQSAEKLAAAKARLVAVMVEPGPEQRIVWRESVLVARAENAELRVKRLEAHAEAREEACARLERTVEGMRKALTDVQWGPHPLAVDTDKNECAWCLHTQREGHDNDCAIAAALAASSPDHAGAPAGEAGEGETT